MNNKLFSIGEAVKVGWEKAKANLGPFFLILLATWLVSGIFSSLANSAQKDSSFLAFVLNLAGFVAGTFLQMGIVRAALKVLDGGRPAFADFASSAEQFGKFLLAVILNAAAVMIGFVLLIIPGIILAIRLQFAPYLIVEKNLGPVEALKRSWAMSRGQTWNLFLLWLVSILIVLLGLIALVVGLIWAVPTVLVAMAFVYRKLERAPMAAAPAQQPAA